MSVQLTAQRLATAEPAEAGLLKVVGLMSGTSMDGIDAALVETDGEGQVRPGPAISIPFEPDFRARLSAFIAGTPERDAATVGTLERALTDLHAGAVRRLVEESGQTLSAIDLIGFHGQTIWHRPAQRQTWQMGDGARLARTLQVPVAFDFRSDDVHAGGQGAPLVPVYHAALAGAGMGGVKAGGVAVVNIGGVANITWIPEAAGGRTPMLLGFDTGPGNGLIDDWVKARLGLSMDRDGALAARGRVHEDALAALLAHPYFAAPAPKSLDRFAFKTDLLKDFSDEDGAATLTAFTAATIARAIDLCPRRPGRLLVTGGGRHNRTLMEAIRTFAGLPVEAVEAMGWQGDALEAQAFAYLAVRCLKKLPITFPGTTGIANPMSGGRIAAP